MYVDDDEVWGEAKITYPNWTGTVQLDPRMTGDWDIHDAIGLDVKSWVLVGFNIHSGEDGRRYMHVYAAPKDTWNNQKLDPTSDVEVTEFYVHDVDPFEILERFIHDFDLRLRIRLLENQKIVIRSRSDLPHGKFEDEIFG